MKGQGFHKLTAYERVGKSVIEVQLEHKMNIKY